MQDSHKVFRKTYEVCRNGAFYGLFATLPALAGIVLECPENFFLPRKLFCYKVFIIVVVLLVLVTTNAITFTFTIQRNVIIVLCVRKRNH